MSVSLADRAVLITGATRGIGAGIAAYFAAAGARLVLSGRDLAAGAELAGKLRAAGAAVTFAPYELADPDAPRALAEQAVSVLGGLDVVIHSAGIYPAMGLAELTLDTWNQVLQVNLTAAMLLAQAALPALERSGTGRIVMISSITGPRTGFAELAHYGAAKAGLEGFVRSAAVELGSCGITVNCVAPGTIMTETLRGLLDDETCRMLAERIPAGRIGQPADIAAAAAFFASAESSFVTGQSLIIDGGQTLREIQ
ncbi:MAG: SDR family NAD(P)-dependent oxidoreductase [Streptosporangiaceae bacterium]